MPQKALKINFKHSPEDKKKLDYISKKGGVNTSEAIRKSIAYAYQSLKDILDPEPEHNGLSSSDQ
ncbi:hypothetical protein [Carboxylicivirga sp. RSCT41]|uniref:hypothetical protein n=1 Tax=Carboxylicivirga agarovorans TaxID=3417570 RepID=UPI003D340F2C